MALFTLSCSDSADPEAPFLVAPISAMAESKQAIFWRYESMAWLAEFKIAKVFIC